MIWNGVFNKGPHEYHYDDRRPVTTEKKFNVLTQDESYAAQEQQRGRGSREDINGFPGLRGSYYSVCCSSGQVDTSCTEGNWRELTPWAPLSPAQGSI